MNLPNLLTLLRLACLPLTILIYRQGMVLWAAVLFAGIMLADCADGWLARRFRQQTWLGTYLDPVADKIVLIAMFYELARAGLTDMAVPHLLLARELLHSAVRDVAAARGTVVGANWMGKTKAFLQTALVLWGLSFPAQCSAAGQSRLAFAIAAWAVVATAWAFFAVFAIRNRAVLRGNPA